LDERSTRYSGQHLGFDEGEQSINSRFLGTETTYF